MARKRTKIFVIGDSVYRSETVFLKKIRSIVNREGFETSRGAKVSYQIYDISESGTLLEYKTSLDQIKVGNERDLQIKTLLDQLDPIDSAILNIINTYPELETDNRRRDQHLRNLNNIKFDTEAFKKYIINNKDYFLSRSSDLEWFKSILTIHNFRDCYTSTYVYNSAIGRSTRVEATEEVKEAFKNAKKEIKSKPKNKK